MTEYKRYLVTAALPYANGPVHIGHLAGVYVPADIYVRYLRMNKKDVVFVCICCFTAENTFFQKQ